MTQPEAAPDLDRLLRKAADGDAQAWRSLVERYSGRVFGLLLQQCGDPELSEEITQATFVKIVTNIANYHEQGRFEPWLFRIAMNRLRDEMRRRKRQATPTDMTLVRGDDAGAWAGMEQQVVAARETSDGQAQGADPADIVDRAEQVEILQRAIAQLGEADREILHLRHTAGMGFAEIAQTLEQPLGTVLARGHRALAKLKKILNPDAPDNPSPRRGNVD